MDKIEVTPEMRQRVLRNVEAAQRKKQKRLVRQLVSLAVWTDGQYAYSISVAVPISREIFTALIEENFG